MTTLAAPVDGDHRMFCVYPDCKTRASFGPTGANANGRDVYCKMHNDLGKHDDVASVQGPLPTTAPVPAPGTQGTA